MRRIGFVCLMFVVLVYADDGYVTCGSVIKLRNNNDGLRLHSHDVKYGSGSGQQSVTGMMETDDVNSHWQILPPLKGKCKRGDEIKCGDKIRLMHLTTKCLLHSHMFNAPLSRSNQEVSCFGRDGEGDSGDHWIVLCNTEEWLRGEPVRLKHEDTGKFLASSGQQYGRPISGQGEVVGVSSPGNSAYWKTVEGVYMIKSKDM
uniref:Stromal cell-derived factor 2 n=1 Tax=Ascaris suum TaxID=6253 RepID=F1L0D9_ASCSU